MAASTLAPAIQGTSRASGAASAGRAANAALSEPQPLYFRERSLGTLDAFASVDMGYTIPFETVRLKDIAEVGGKNASLGELVSELSPCGIAVPRGFALSVRAFRDHLVKAGLSEHLYGALAALDPTDVAALAKLGAAIRAQVRDAPLPADVERELLKAYQELSRSYGEEQTDVAVRSSATAEDLPTASFAGQQESYLNVRGASALVQAVRDCMASLFTDRAIAYRAERGFDHRKVGLSVGVQKMVRSDLGAAGVIFTLDTESGSRDVVIVTSSWGLGESVVKGRVNPDEFWVHKPTFEQGFASIIRRDAGDKSVTRVYGAEGTTEEIATDPVLDGVLVDVTDGRVTYKYTVATTPITVPTRRTSETTFSVFPEERRSEASRGSVPSLARS